MSCFVSLFLVAGPFVTQAKPLIGLQPGDFIRITSAMGLAETGVFRPECAQTHANRARFRLLRGPEEVPAPQFTMWIIVYILRVCHVRRVRSPTPVGV
jgi:hypothetical protein